MKKNLSILATIMLVAPLSFASAEITALKAVKPAIIPNIENRAENKIQKIENKVDSLKKVENKLEEKKQKIEDISSSTEKRIEKKQEINKKRISDLVTLTTRKVNAAINRIEILAGRTEERLNILADRGVVKAETKTAVLAKLDEARKAISEATSSVTKIEETAKLALESLNIKESIKDVKAVTKEIQEKVKLAHSKVVDAVSLIKASLPKDTKATTTPEKVENKIKN